MKPLIFLILLFTLTANTFASSGMCMAQVDVSTQPVSHDMPCHDVEQGDTHEATPHLCECDQCAQYIYFFVSVTPHSPIVDPLLFSVVQHKSPKFTPNYRPPIYFTA